MRSSSIQGSSTSSTCRSRTTPRACTCGWASPSPRTSIPTSCCSTRSSRSATPISSSGASARCNGSWTRARRSSSSRTRRRRSVRSAGACACSSTGELVFDGDVDGGLAFYDELVASRALGLRSGRRSPAPGTGGGLRRDCCLATESIEYTRVLCHCHPRGPSDWIRRSRGSSRANGRSCSRCCTGRSCSRLPHRVVHPPSWLDHIPFAFWIVDALRPGVFVELGTHSGNSHAAFAQAIQTLGLPTAAYAVDTWEGDHRQGSTARMSNRMGGLPRAALRVVLPADSTTFEDAAQHFLTAVSTCCTWTAATSTRRSSPTTAVAPEAERARRDAVSRHQHPRARLRRLATVGRAEGATARRPSSSCTATGSACWVSEPTFRIPCAGCSRAARIRRRTCARSGSSSPGSAASSRPVSLQARWSAGSGQSSRCQRGAGGGPCGRARGARGRARGANSRPRCGPRPLRGNRAHAASRGRRPGREADRVLDPALGCLQRNRRVTRRVGRGRHRTRGRRRSSCECEARARGSRGGASRGQAVDRGAEAATRSGALHFCRTRPVYADHRPASRSPVGAAARAAHASGARTGAEGRQTLAPFFTSAASPPRAIPRGAAGRRERAVRRGVLPGTVHRCVEEPDDSARALPYDGRTRRATAAPAVRRRRTTFVRTRTCSAQAPTRWCTTCGCGASEGRSPHPLFDVSYYLQTNPDVSARRVRAAPPFPAVRRRGRAEPERVFRLRALPAAEPGRRQGGDQSPRTFRDRWMARRPASFDAVRRDRLPRGVSRTCCDAPATTRWRTTSSHGRTKGRRCRETMPTGHRPRSRDRGGDAIGGPDGEAARSGRRRLPHDTLPFARDAVPATSRERIPDLPDAVLAAEPRLSRRADRRAAAWRSRHDEACPGAGGQVLECDPV